MTTIPLLLEEDGKGGVIGAKTNRSTVVEATINTMVVGRGGDKVSIRMDENNHFFYAVQDNL